MPADLMAQVQSLLAVAGNNRPPLHLWHPPLSGDIDIRIAADGTWYHEDSAFQREALVRLFASIMRREGDAYFLVTPVEKWRIVVERTPFVAVDCDVLGEGAQQQLVFLTNVGERVHVGPEHPLLMVLFPGDTDAHPCVEVRDGLLARLARSVYYRLVDTAVSFDGQGRAGLWSGGEFFLLAE